jgi:ketosteroid isomerase-like protein
MSQKNVEVVREAIDAFQRGEFEAALSAFSEEVVFQPLVAGPYYGRAGVAKQMQVWVDEFDDYWFEGDEFIDAGDEVVLLWRHGGVGKASGIRTEAEGGTVFSVDDGRISRAQVYPDQAEALEAARLSE